jgi:hypothetical protein
MSDDSKIRKRYASLFWPIVLIVIGVVFLLNNLGMLSQSAWDTILLCWPFLFMVIGLDGLLRREGAAVSIYFICLGAILLLCNFDQLDWGAWDVIFVIWPVFLVAVGLDIVFGRRSIWGRLLAGLVVVMIFGGVLWFYSANIIGGKLAVDIIEQPIQGAEQSQVTITPLVGNLLIDSSDDPKNLITGVVKHARGEKIQEKFRLTGKTAVYSLQSEGGTILLPASLGSGASWDLKITSQIPVDLTASMIMGTATVQAEELFLENLQSSLVVGKTMVKLPEKGKVSVKIEGVIGEITIVVPDSMEVSINLNTGLTSVQVPGNYIARERNFFSPGYIESQNQANMDVSQVIGVVRVITK